MSTTHPVETETPTEPVRCTSEADQVFDAQLRKGSARARVAGVVLAVAAVAIPAVLSLPHLAIGGTWETDPDHPWVSYPPGTLAHVSVTDRDGHAACYPAPGTAGDPGRCAAWTEASTHPATILRVEGGTCDLRTTAECLRAAGIEPTDQPALLRWSPVAAAGAGVIAVLIVGLVRRKTTA